MSRRTWTESEDFFIKENYRNMEYAKIAQALCRTAVAVRKRAIRLGIRKREEVILFSKEEEQALIEIYENTSPYLRKGIIEKSFPGRSYHAVVAKAGRMGIAPSNTRIYKFDESYFEKIDSHRKAYFYGFWCADGDICKNTVGLTQQESDSYLLDEFMRDIRHKKEKRYRNTKTNVICSVSVCSKKMVSDLKALGGSERKSLVIEFPKAIEGKYYRAFIRGLFDGDGHVGQTAQGYPRVSIVGSISMIREVHKILCSVTGSDMEKNYALKGRGAVCEWGGEPAMKILSWIYDFDENHPVFMLRKKERYDKMKEGYNRGDGALGSTGG